MGHRHGGFCRARPERARDPSSDQRRIASAKLLKAASSRRTPRRASRAKPL